LKRHLKLAYRQS